MDLHVELCDVLESLLRSAPSDRGMNDQTVGTWYRLGSFRRRRKLGITTDEAIFCSP